MSATSSSSASSTPTSGGSFTDLLNGNDGNYESPNTIGTLVAAIAAAAVSFGVQLLVFYLLRFPLTRIYRPKTYLVPENQRVPAPPPGSWQWIVPLFTTPNSVFIEKCGLDAYFFLRYLRMLLKIFVPLALLILPILMPINKYSGNQGKGLDEIAWANISPNHIQRTWAHLILALIVISWVCYVLYDELRGYIRIRQAYLTSPQHRIRASATTVLVSGIPRKWLTLEALNGLYDVFPGGIRNIWINRNYDELYTKVKQRDKIARNLESAETSLIKKCVKKHKKAEDEKAKQAAGRKRTKEEKKQDDEVTNAQAERVASGLGLSSGDPHHTPRNLHQVINEMDGGRDSDRKSRMATENKSRKPLTMVTGGLNALGMAGKHIVGGVGQGVGTVLKDVNATVDAANTGTGFADSDSIYQPDKSMRDEYSVADRYLEKTSPRNQSGLHSQPQISLVRDEQESTHARGRNPSDGVDATDYAPAVPSNNNSLDGSSEKQTGMDTTGDSFEALRTRNTAPGKRRDSEAKTPTGPFAKLMKHRKAPPIAFPSPEPHVYEGDEYPLGELNAAGQADINANPNQQIAKSKLLEVPAKVAFWQKATPVTVEYPQAIEKEYAEGDDDDALWKKYVLPKDRDTLRNPIVNQPWFPRLPFVGQKTDKIYFLRKELARLNVEIEHDQQDPERFPFMNSAFIQFNHQVAAHMACQSLSHHIPQHMAPRLVEISPSDVLWENMSIKWWERYMRVGVTTVLMVGLIILYAVPVTFTSFLSQVNYLAHLYTWLAWLAKLPTAVISIIQGILPPILLSVILMLVPIIFRQLVGAQGVPTGSERERGVAQYYFIFLFIQVFLVVTLTSGITSFIQAIYSDPEGLVTDLAKDLPKASNYFFSYMIVQALGNSASTLLQVMPLIFWFILAPILDSTPRQKWSRQTNLQNVQWGSYFPPFTNFAVIGLVYSVIAPLIMVFNLITFSLYWVVQRYNILYVYQFQNDTGGLLFPSAVHQLFAGLYFLELCMIGLFFLARNAQDQVACVPQGVIMIIALVCTILFQYLLDKSFAPLIRYLPITLEDEAVIRDEEFARAQHAKFQGLTAEEPDDDDIEDRLEDRERREHEQEDMDIEAERMRIQEARRAEHRNTGSQRQLNSKPSGSWKKEPWKKAFDAGAAPVSTVRRFASKRVHRQSHMDEKNRDDSATGSPTNDKPRRSSERERDEDERRKDVEAQRTMGDALFSGLSDELEDLTVEERDALVRYSFQHAALRARRPVVWIPRDSLGVSDDEIMRCKRMSTVMLPDGEGQGGSNDRKNSDRSDRKNSDRMQASGERKTNIWISNEGTALDAKGKVVFRRSPPDFSNVDLIAL